MEDIEALVTAIQNGDTTQVEALWLRVEGFVRGYAGKWYYRGGDMVKRRVDIDDLVQAGFLATLKAVEKYNAERGCTFISYLALFLRTAFSREIYGHVHDAQHNHIDPLLAATSLDAPCGDDGLDGITLLDSISDPTAEDAFRAVNSAIHQAQVRGVIKSALFAVSRKRRVIVWAHAMRGESFEALGIRFGISRARVAELFRSTLSILRHNPDLQNAYCETCNQRRIDFYDKFDLEAESLKSAHRKDGVVRSARRYARKVKLDRARRDADFLGFTADEWRKLDEMGDAFAKS